MREIARIQLRGDVKDLIQSWNTTKQNMIEQRLIVLYKDTPEYLELKLLFDDFARFHEMKWVERIEVEYSDQELLKFEILTLHIVGQAGAGNNKFAQVYRTELICPFCGLLSYVQERNLVLNLLVEQDDPLEIGYFQHDICETDFHELVTSKKLQELLLSARISGIALRAVEHIIPNVPVPREYFQLVIEQEIGPLIPPSPIQRLDLCAECGRYKSVLFDALPGTGRSEFYFPRGSYQEQPILKTSDCFGRGTNFQCKIIISQSFYRLLKENAITGYWVEPAHLVPIEGSVG